MWIARDKNGMLSCYSVKPTKGETKWRVGLIKNFVGFVYSGSDEQLGLFNAFKMAEYLQKRGII